MFPAPEEAVTVLHCLRGEVEVEVEAAAAEAEAEAEAEAAAEAGEPEEKETGKEAWVSREVVVVEKKLS